MGTRNDENSLTIVMERLNILQTRRERLKSALYLRLKKRKFSKYAQDVFMKSFENTLETPKVPFMLYMTGKSLFPDWEQNKI